MFETREGAELTVLLAFNGYTIAEADEPTKGDEVLP
jgi:hypothetical protein